MEHECSTNCFYFPCDEVNIERDIDQHGIKIEKEKVRCNYDGHLFRAWKLCQHYSPLNHKTPKLIIFEGKSASGKDTCINFLLKKYPDIFAPVISYTTRPKRENEVDGVDYHFINDGLFKKMLSDGKFPDTRSYNTLFNGKKDVWWYGVKGSDILDADKILLSAVDIDGYYNLEKFLGKEAILTIYLDCEDIVRKNRAKRRGSFSDTEWNRRLKDDNQKFEISTLKKFCDYYIDNDGVEKELYRNLEKCLENEGIL